MMLTIGQRDTSARLQAASMQRRESSDGSFQEKIIGDDTCKLSTGKKTLKLSKWMQDMIDANPFS